MNAAVAEDLQPCRLAWPRTDTRAGIVPATSAVVAGHSPLPTRATLADGRVAYLRAIDRSDCVPLREELFLKLSPESLRNRFFAVKLDLTPPELSYLCDVDFVRHVAIVVSVECGSHRRLVGVARFVRATPTAENAEVAITVIDHFQGMGIGKLLLNRLIDSARELGVSRFEGSMLTHNRRMANLLRQTRLPLILSREQDTVSLSMTLR